MKIKIVAILILLSISALAFQTSPYARRIRPFSSTPSSCQENEIGYNMTAHTLHICKNSGYVELTTGSSGSFAPVNATYITQTANATLTNEQALASLATGILKNTTTTGILSIGTAGDVNSILPTQTSNSGKFLTTNGTVSSWATISSGITNAAGNNVIPKSDGTNLVASRISDDGTNPINIDPSELPSPLLNIGRSGIVATGIFQVYGTSGDFTTGNPAVSIQAETNLGDDDGQVRALKVRALSLNGGDLVPIGDVVGGDFDASAAKNSSAVYAVVTSASASGAITVTNMWSLLVSGNISGGATVTNNYGIEVQDISGGTNNWAIKTGVGRVRFSDVLSLGGDLQLTKTITGSGTTGEQTINKSSGSVNFAAGATSLVVTNSLVTTGSIVHCTVGANDTTFKSAQCVAGSGIFTIFSNAAATDETRVNFLVTN